MMRAQLLVLTTLITAPTLHAYSTKTILGSCLAGTALYQGYRWLTTPVKQPITPENLHIVTFAPAHNPITTLMTVKNPIDALRTTIISNTPFNVTIPAYGSYYTLHNGLPTPNEVVNNTIFIYSAGWIGGPGFKSEYRYRHAGSGAVLAHRALKSGYINGTVVAFDYPTDWRASFNFGQDDDLACLRLVYQSVIKKYPKANIIFVTDSKGGAITLNLITHPAYKDEFKQVKALILESPPVTLEYVARSISEYWMLGLPGTFTATYALYKLYFPNFDESKVQATSFMHAASANIPSNLPIFIGQIVGDTMASNDGTQTIVKTLQRTGNQHIYVFTTRRTANHGQLGSAHVVPEFPMAVNEFLRLNGMPHHAELAEEWREFELTRATKDRASTAPRSL